METLSMKNYKNYMPVIKASILPHSPLLVPEIGRANYGFLEATNNAYKKIGEDLLANPPETILIITPHGSSEEIFNINTAPEMEVSFQDFGFIPPKTFLKGDVLLSDQINTYLKERFPIHLNSESLLDYGSAVPAYLLKNLGVDFKIITITPSEKADLRACYEFGQELKKFLSTSDKKIAVISSSDLSHRLKKKSPAGYSPKGAKFDNKIIEYLNELKTAAESILKMDTKIIKDAGECGLKPIMIILGLIHEEPLESKVLAYQTDFGVGYLSLGFKEIEKFDNSYDEPRGE